ncbi:glycoside hydrolase family 10 [Opitutaceae bacterium TAV5]|nr:glycoside hydrolase family 10 [Opitutaceae bacterium TAV5]
MKFSHPPLRLVSLAALTALACIVDPVASHAANPPGTRPPSAIRKIRTGQPVEVYAPGESLKWRITLVNPSTTTPLSGSRLVWTVSAWPQANPSDTPAPSGEIPVPAIPPGDNAVINLDHTPSALGWHEVALELRDTSDALIDRQTRTFSVGHTPRSTGRHFRYGLCSHMRRHIGTPLFEKEAALADRLGIDIIRTELAGWESTQPSEGQWNWKAADQVLDTLTPLGIEIQPIFAYTTRWASTGDPNAKDWNDWNKTAPRLTPWHTYVRTVMERYGERARYWEIWNEPDISFWRATTEQYIELFNTSSALIKKASPRAQVLNGGLAMVKRQPNPDFVQTFVARADKSNWDVFAYHDYHTFAQFLTRRAEVGEHLANLSPDMPLWINEGGHHTLLAGGEHEQALTLVKKLTTSPAQGISAYFWYNLRDDGLDPREPEHHFGLTRYDGQPKPAWSAYQNLIRELGSARYHSSLPAAELPPGTWAHLYERTDSPAGQHASHVLVLWQEGSSRNVPVWLGTDNSQARITQVLNLMGNPLPASITDQGAVIDLSREPVYVHINHDQAPRLVIKPILDAPPLLVLIPDAPSPLRIQISNPLAAAATAQLRLTSDLPGLTLPADHPPITLKPGETVRQSLDLHLAPASPPPSSNDKHRPVLNLHLSIPEAGLDLPARIPLVLAKQVPALASGSGIGSLPPLARLDRQTDIFNLYSAEPLPAMHWHGPGDLSATARIAHDGAALHIEVVARDDVHHQTNIREELWAGDSLQIGIRLLETDSGYIELGLALGNDGKTGGWVFSTTPDSALPLGRLDPPVNYTVSRDQSAAATYRIRLPWAALGGKDGKPPSDSFRLTFIVNDNDAKGRKQWVKLSDGLGDQKTPDLWPIFVCP